MQMTFWEKVNVNRINIGSLHGEGGAQDAFCCIFNPSMAHMNNFDDR